MRKRNKNTESICKYMETHDVVNHVEISTSLGISMEAANRVLRRMFRNKMIDCVGETDSFRKTFTIKTVKIYKVKGKGESVELDENEYSPIVVKKPKPPEIENLVGLSAYHK